MNRRFATRLVDTAFAIVLCFVAGGISAGDGALFRDIRNRCGRPDIAIIPIGAYKPRWFMSDQHVAPEESVRIFQDVGARQAVGMHWGTFQLTNEARNEPRDLLRDSLVSACIDVTRFLALEPGEFFSDSAATASHTQALLIPREILRLFDPEFRATPASDEKIAAPLDDWSNASYIPNMDNKTKDTRSHILSVGRSLTARQGYSGVGLNELLKAADVPKGSFYHYFASKEAYGCALLDDFVTQYRESLGETLLNPKFNARSRLMSYFEGWLRKQTGPDPQDRCLVVKLSAEVADLSTDMSKILQRGVSDIVVSLTKTIEEGVSDGSIAPINDPGAVAHALYHQWLGASLIAGLTQDSSPLDTALKSTSIAVPAA